ncbi:hypothetical protein [Undibacterium sp. Ji49W]|uniref:hypothetical protein n=1 Tax=Undibacterium sp. Ji49W TaxID=3413040 RepID=UPI003BF1ED36
MSASVDLRGFFYQLEPVQNKTQWELDLIEVQLADALRELEQCRVDIELKQLRKREQSDLARTSWQTNFNMLTHQSALGFLVMLETDIMAGQKHLNQLSHKVATLRGECVLLQQKIQLMDSHRNECLDEYAAEQLRQQTAEIDRDWSARSIWRDKMKGTLT